MCTPRSTVGSYSKVSVGVRLRRSSVASRACRTPCAEESASRLRSRLRTEPSTLTYTRAVRRSFDVRTPVIVTNPMRGSFRSPRASESTSRTDSLTRRMRSFIRDHDLALGARHLVLLPVQEAERAVEQSVELVVLARDTGEGQPCALPELVVVALRHRRAEAILQLRLRGLDVLA